MILMQSSAMLMINPYYFDGGGRSGMVVVLDHCHLPALLPVPHQQHDGFLMEVMEVDEK